MVYVSKIEDDVLEVFFSVFEDVNFSNCNSFLRILQSFISIVKSKNIDFIHFNQLPLIQIVRNNLLR